MYNKIGLCLLLVVALLIGAHLFLPITVTHATSESMAPAIHEGDAYLVIESESIANGDIITFHSTDHGTYVTHRVVGRTADGFITRGDANSETDQAAGMPPVHPSTVLGSVYTVDGRPLTVPGIGVALTHIHGRNIWFALGLLVILLVDILAGRESGRPNRGLVLVRHVGQLLLIGTFVWCLAVVAMSGGEHEFTYVVSAEETPAAHTVLPGDAATQTVVLSHQSTPLTTVIVDVSGGELIDRRIVGSELVAEITVPPRDSIGAYPVSVRTRAYPTTLPPGAIQRLHGVHWVLAGIASLLPVFVPLTVAYLLLFDGLSPIRIVSRRRVSWLRGDHL